MLDKELRRLRAEAIERLAKLAADWHIIGAAIARGKRAMDPRRMSSRGRTDARVDGNRGKLVDRFGNSEAGTPTHAASNSHALVVERIPPMCPAGSFPSSSLKIFPPNSKPSSISS
jgi:hypothetical protein